MVTEQIATAEGYTFTKHKNARHAIYYTVNNPLNELVTRAIRFELADNVYREEVDRARAVKQAIAADANSASIEELEAAGDILDFMSLDIDKIGGDV